MPTASRRLIFSSIWQRFVIRFTVTSAIFLVLTLLLILHVSLPRSSSSSRLALDRQILLSQQRLLRDLLGALEAQPGQSGDPAAVLAERVAEVEVRIAEIDEIAALQSSERTPANQDQIADRIETLEGRNTPVLEEYAFEPVIRSVHKRMGLIVLVIFVCIAGMMFVFIRDVVTPLEGIISTSRMVAAGNLAVTFPVRVDKVRRDELDDLSVVLNDLMANFQEAFLLIGSLNQEIATVIKLSDKKTGAKLAATRAELFDLVEQISEILESFDFFQSGLPGEASAPTAE